MKGGMEDKTSSTALAIAFTAGVAAGYCVKCYLTQQRKALENNLSTGSISEEGLCIYVCPCDTRSNLTYPCQVIYNVDVSVDPSASIEFQKWLPGHAKVRVHET